MKTISLAKLLLPFAMVICCSNSGFACLCSSQSPKKAFARAKSSASTIFVGQAIEVVNGFSNGEFPGWRIKFQVAEYWKGKPGAEMVVFTGPDDCAAHFEVGKKYLVFASWSESRHNLTTNVCMQTALFEMSADNLKRLGKGKVVGKETASVYPTRSTTSAWSGHDVCGFFVK